MKLLFWLFVLIDAAALVVFGLLGLAAAGPSRTNPIAALVIPFFIPALILAAAIWIFLNAQASGARLVALFVAALPVIIVVASQGIGRLTMSAHTDADGNVSQFREGPLREIESAIARHDADAVKAAASGVDVNKPGISGATVLTLALRELRNAPTQLDVVRALLAAGANPNIPSSELPLQQAIGASRVAGVEPVRLLLDAGANPNARNDFDSPVYFIAGGTDIDADVMKLLLDKGADVRLTDREGRGAVYLPATVRNWPVVLLLLERGAPWRDQQGVGGLPFRAWVEGEARQDTTNGLAQVLAFLRTSDART